MRFSEWSRHSFMGFGSCFPKNPLKKRHITIFLFWGWAPLPPPNLNFVKMWGFRERSKWIMLQGESSDWVRSFCIVSIMYRGYRKKLLEPLEHVLNIFTRSALTFVTDFAEMVYAPNFRAWALEKMTFADLFDEVTGGSHLVNLSLWCYIMYRY